MGKFGESFDKEDGDGTSLPSPSMRGTSPIFSTPKMSSSKESSPKCSLGERSRGEVDREDEVRLIASSKFTFGTSGPLQLLLLWLL